MVLQVCVVTGGNGFVGQCLVRQLLQAGSWKVVILDIQPQPRLSLEDKEAAALLDRSLQDGRAQYICGDLRKADQVDEALQGAFAVFHVASPSSHANDAKLFYDVNVVGTQNVLDACLKHGVKKLIFTSSASVVFDGSDIRNGDESLPYPTKPLDAYSDTKAQAEQLVLAANGKGGLLTCAVRPSGIFGPGDPMMLPTLVKQARNGKMKMVIGDGKNLWDFTFVDNVAHAHLCAEKALQPGKEEADSASGKAFFVTNGEPFPFWDFSYAQLQALGYDGPKMHLPAAPVYYLAVAVDAVVALLNKYVLQQELRTEFTPSRMRLVTSWRYFNNGRAAKLLAYHPPVPLQEGMKRAVACRRDLRREEWEKSQQVWRPAKVHRALGGGAVADLLLWRQPVQTLAVLLLPLLLLWHTSTSDTGALALLADAGFAVIIACLLLDLARRAAALFGRRSLEIPDLAALELSERATKQAFRRGAAAVNRGLGVAERAARGDDVWLFLRVVLTLWLLSWGASLMSTACLLASVYVALFVLPPLYERHEDKVDRFINIATARFNGLKQKALQQLPRRRSQS